MPPTDEKRGKNTDRRIHVTERGVPLLRSLHDHMTSHIDPDSALGGAAESQRWRDLVKTLVGELEADCDLLFGLRDYFEPGHELGQIGKRRDSIWAVLTRARAELEKR